MFYLTIVYALLKGGEVTQEEKGEELLQQEEEQEQDHQFTEDRKPAVAAAHVRLTLLLTYLY